MPWQLFGLCRTYARCKLNDVKCSVEKRLTDKGDKGFRNLNTNRMRAEHGPLSRFVCNKMTFDWVTHLTHTYIELKTFPGIRNCMTKVGELSRSNNLMPQARKSTIFTRHDHSMPLTGLAEQGCGTGVVAAPSWQSFLKLQVVVLFGVGVALKEEIWRNLQHATSHKHITRSVNPFASFCDAAPRLDQHPKAPDTCWTHLHTHTHTL